MTAPVLKIRVLQRPTLKGKMDVRFPASVSVSSPILLDRTGGNYAFSIDAAALIALLTGTFQPYEGVEQHIQSAGPVTINAGTGIARVNQTVGAAITLNLPLAAAKTCPVLICDWKGDAGTNAITLTPSGSEKIQGRSSWTINADNASLFLRPIPNVGYVI